MDFLLHPWQLYVVILAGWINRQQQEVIDYLRTENHVLKEKHGGKRILLNDDQRRRLAVKGKILGRKRQSTWKTFLQSHWDVLAGTASGTCSWIAATSSAPRSKASWEGIEPVPLPPKSPNWNVHLERFFGSLKFECLERTIFFGETTLRTAIRQSLEPCHAERNHQGLAHQILQPGNEVGRGEGPVQCRERLGGLLRYYYRDAA